MNLFDLGALLAFIGIVVVIIGLMVEIFKNIRSESRDKSQTQVGGIIMIGPIPIVFGNSKDAIRWALIAAIVLFLLFIFLAIVSYYI